MKPAIIIKSKSCHNDLAMWAWLRFSSQLQSAYQPVDRCWATRRTLAQSNHSSTEVQTWNLPLSKLTRELKMALTVNPDCETDG